MRFEYYDIWNNDFKMPISPIDIKEVSARQKKGKSYCVVAFDSMALPIAYAEISPNRHAVNFLGEDFDVYLTYSFTPLDGKLFLQYIIFSEKDKRTNYNFNQSGSLVIEDIDLVNKTRTVRTSENKVDLSPNWEKIPENNDWSSLFRKERG